MTFPLYILLKSSEVAAWGFICGLLLGLELWLIRLLPQGVVAGMRICDYSLRRRIEEAFRRDLFRLVDDYLRSPENKTQGEILGVLRSYLLISETLQDCAKPTCEHRIESVVVLNAASGRIASAERIARQLTGTRTPSNIASQEGRGSRKVPSARTGSRLNRLLP